MTQRKLPRVVRRLLAETNVAPFYGTRRSTAVYAIYIVRSAAYTRSTVTGDAEDPIPSASFK